MEEFAGLYDFINEWLINLWFHIGCDMPENHNDLCQYLTSDVRETADPYEWHSGDVGIAFRRWVEEHGEFL